MVVDRAAATKRRCFAEEMKKKRERNVEKKTSTRKKRNSSRAVVLLNVLKIYRRNAVTREIHIICRERERKRMSLVSVHLRGEGDVRRFGDFSPVRQRGLSLNREAQEGGAGVEVVVSA